MTLEQESFSQVAAQESRIQRMATVGMLAGGIVSATLLANYADRGYSPERVEVIDEQIHEFDEKSHLALEDNCQDAVYDYLRSSNSMPANPNEVKKALTKTCDTKIDDDAARLVGSYVADIGTLQLERNTHDKDLRFVSFPERAVYGLLGANLISTMRYPFLWRARKQQRQPKYRIGAS